MSTKLIDDTHMSNIANAIRSKAGTSAPIAVGDMAQAITDIPSGGSSKLPSVIDRSVTSLDANDFGSVTYIGDYAFYGCSLLTNASLSNNITHIQQSAFQNCQYLRYITMSNSLTQIGSSAFMGCTRLRDFTLPNTVTTIGDRAFRECLYLTSITIPEGVTVLNGYTFYGSTAIQTINLPSTLTTINTYEFAKCYQLNNFTIPSGVTTIPKYCFSGAFKSPDTTTYRSVYLPDTLTKIDASAFEMSPTTYKPYSNIDLYCPCQTPPTLGSNVFYYRKARVHIPAGTLSAYQSAWASPGGSSVITYVEDL